ncbi:hypothetical protein Y032_0010g1004 [Ancylostoma ceylanicum]|uniref:alkaline phosphatase n=1 Tax=Ancylostoma ceylanicum TaxID=53326 RepID=A0A016VFW9_9BILA|nr:hypothetical protein Y032_0010g1004 [Ancylostoma ceylanicum]
MSEEPVWQCKWQVILLARQFTGVWPGDSIITGVDSDGAVGIEDIEFWNNVAKDHIDRKLKANPRLLKTKKPRNIILFIGDGMGMPVVTSARINRNQIFGNSYLNEPFFFEKFRTAGLVKTSSLDHHVTDSAAGAMALFSGRKVMYGTLGSRPNFLVGVKKCTTDRSRHLTDGIAEGALQKALEVGFVTTTRITHATPAALYAKGIHRSIEYDGDARKINRALGKSNCPDIASQLLSYPASEFKVLMGGGADYLLNKSRGGKREDGKNIDIEWSKLGGKRRVLRDERDLQAITASDEKLLGIFAPSQFPMYVVQQLHGRRTVPRLMDMTTKAIEQLQQGEMGFFLMVEGGMIDIAEHRNQIRAAFGELYELDEAIRKAREMTDPSETLIIVTSDHDHAVTMPGYSPADVDLLNSDVIENKKENGTDLYEMPGIFFAQGPGFDGDGLKISNRKMDKRKRRHPLYRLPTSAPAPRNPHSAADVGVWADGPLSELFSSSLENTEIAYIIKFLLCTNNTDHTFCAVSYLTSASLDLEQAAMEYGDTHKLFLPVFVMLSTTSLSLLIANLSLVYLRFASVNLSDEQQGELLPLLLEALSSKINDHMQAVEILALCIPGFIVLSQKERSTWPTFSLPSEVKALLLRFFYCIIAFDVNSPEDVEQTCAYVKSSKKVFTHGQSPDEFLMVAEKIVSKTCSFVQVKLAVIKLLVSGLFEDQAVFSILVLGTAQSIEVVSDAAETALKKVDIQSSVDNRVIVDELMASYLGIVTPTKPMIGKATVVSPVSTAMKQKILQYLTRSAVAPVAYMNNMKVCLEGLTHTSRTDSKLLIAALNFLVKVIEKMPAAAQKNFGPLLFDRVQKIQEGEVKNGVALSLMYRCLGILGKRDSSILTGQADTIGHTFKSIAEVSWLKFDSSAGFQVDCDEFGTWCTCWR